MTEAETKAVARAICRERCADYGDPPCYAITDSGEFSPNCDDPGCVSLAEAAIRALDECRAKVEA